LIRGEWIMRFLIAAISAAAFLVSVNVAKADKRVAFVVGNGAYPNVAALPNPAVDAKAMAKLLRNVGFVVHICLRSRRPEMIPSVSPAQAVRAERDPQ
jgi:hypothetical protein